MNRGENELLAAAYRAEQADRRRVVAVIGISIVIGLVLFAVGYFVK